MTTILLVEDDLAHTELIRRAFEDDDGNDYTLVALKTLHEAQDYLQTHTPDLVFVDFLLPDGQGLDLIHEDSPYPVVMLTSQGNEKLAVDAMKAGALDYVVKSEAVFLQMPHIARRTLREWSHIQQHQRAEQDLKESEEKFRQMLEAASEGIVLVDSAGKIVLVNRYVEMRFRYNRTALLNQPVEILVPSQHQQSHITLREGYLKNAIPRAMGRGKILAAQRSDGTTFPVDISLTPINISGEQMTMCFIIDITERQQLEEQRMYATALEVELEKEREIIELRERFLAIVSHEFRTPLSIINSASDLINQYFDRLSKEQIQTRLNSITKQVERMVGMLNDVLEVSKPPGDKSDLEIQDIEILPFCQQVVKNIVLIDDNAHEIILSNSNIPLTIPADPQALDHIFTNLLTNAVKYSPPGSVVRFEIDQEGQNLCFAITDQGIGIPAADLPRLFTPFHRGKNTKGYQGTGLGLVIVKQHVESHGGRIEVKSVENEGTTFTIYLPASASG